MVQSHRIMGPARVGRRTKDLAHRLKPGDVAIIFHRDLDAMAARQVAERRPAAVVNVEPSITGRYINGGPRVLLEAGIPLFDAAERAWAETLRDGEDLGLSASGVYRGNERLCAAEAITADTVRGQAGRARANLQAELHAFAENTLRYLADERADLLNPPTLPDVRAAIAGRPVLIVVRGEGYREDLKMVRAYIHEQRPVLIGVDGGADALLEEGFTPDILIGDMDSATDDAIRKAREVVVHAYTDGRAPGMERVRQLGYEAEAFAIPGTSEDAAMLLAYERDAALIVAVGTHFALEEFLDKGRAGMASTFLVRLRVGSRLVDAKGVSRLYRAGVSPRHLVTLLLAAFIPIAIVLILSSPLSASLRIWAMKLQFLLWQLRN